MTQALQDIAFSMLDLVPVREGRSVADALARWPRRGMSSAWASRATGWPSTTT
jgi:hypothetical protein